MGGVPQDAGEAGGDVRGLAEPEGDAALDVLGEERHPLPSVEPLEAVWFFRATSWKEANRAWYARNGWTKAAT